MSCSVLGQCFGIQHCVEFSRTFYYYCDHSSSGGSSGRRRSSLTLRLFDLPKISNEDAGRASTDHQRDLKADERSPNKIVRLKAHIPWTLQALAALALRHDCKL